MFLLPSSCRVIATSQMQATHARKTFPCFDEPAMKAVFNVTIIHDRSTAALSNGRDIGPSLRHRAALRGRRGAGPSLLCPHTAGASAITDSATMSEQVRRTR